MRKMSAAFGSGFPSSIEGPSDSLETMFGLGGNRDMRIARCLALASAGALALLAGGGAQIASHAAEVWGRPPATAVSDERASTVVVTSPADNGPGTLRETIANAQPGDEVVFDPTIFPPVSPATIHLNSPLPGITTPYLTLSGTDAGVIIDGTGIPGGEFVTGLEVIQTVGVTIEGLQVQGFSGGGVVAAQSTDCVFQDNVLTRNALGAGTWDAEAARNTIRHNDIVSNDLGISVSHGAHDNLIQENQIHQNVNVGVSVVMEGSSARISRNRIYDNGASGIQIGQGGNDDQAAPQIIGFDLSKGTIEGVICPHCTVEIFSDEADEGGWYEGTAVADAVGYFDFSKDSSFLGPHLTATGTDDAGNTSPFSRPTSGEHAGVDLQESNEQPKTLIPVRGASELSENYIGDQLGGLRSLIHDETTAAQLLEYYERIGYRWTRLSLDPFDWSDVAADPSLYSQWHVDPLYDDFISALADRGVSIIYCLVFWDDQIDPAEPFGWSRFEDADEVQRYLDYAAFIADHFKGRIAYYEIFNESFGAPAAEPGDFSQQNIDLEEYIQLVQEVTPVIRDADPSAGIIAGPAPGLFDQACMDYQLGILSSDAIMPMVDGVSWHPGPFPVELGFGEGAVDHPYRVPDTIQQLRGTAEAHGFNGLYVPEEIQWPTPYNPPDFTNPWNIFSETVSAKYYGRGILDHRGLGMNALLAGTASEGDLPKMDVIRNLANLLAGAEANPLSLDVQSTITDVVSYTFAYAGSDQHLIAMWEGGFASNAIEPGTSLTLTVSGLTQTTDISVTGYDVLHSFRQPMEAHRDGDSLVLPNLQVRDYPLILRLAPIRHVFLPLVLRH
jgi:parallel beta-helix repeat protein